MKLFARKNGKKRWREKALLINPHRTKLVLIKKGRTSRSPPRIYEKLEALAKNSCPQSSNFSPGITMAELAFVERIRQENGPEYRNDDNSDNDERLIPNVYRRLI